MTALFLICFTSLCALALSVQLRPDLDWSINVSRSGGESAVSSAWGGDKLAALDGNIAATIVQKNEGSPNLLSCFMVIMPDSYEVDLLQMMHKKQTGVFACDMFAVFSNVSLCALLNQNTPNCQYSGMDTVLDRSLEVERGGPYDTALNVDIFMTIWRRIAKGQLFYSSSWLVKLDADAVVDVPSLRKLLLKYGGMHPDRVVLNSCVPWICQNLFIGPIETMSMPAFLHMKDSLDMCHSKLNTHQMSEDTFLQECFKLSQVRTVTPSSYLKAFWDPGGAPTRNGDTSACADAKVAYHPFKDSTLWYECLSTNIKIRDHPPSVAYLVHNNHWAEKPLSPHEQANAESERPPWAAPDDKIVLVAPSEDCMHKTNPKLVDGHTEFFWCNNRQYFDNVLRLIDTYPYVQFYFLIDHGGIVFKKPTNSLVERIWDQSGYDDKNDLYLGAVRSAPFHPSVPFVSTSSGALLFASTLRRLWGTWPRFPSNCGDKAFSGEWMFWRQEEVLAQCLYNLLGVKATSHSGFHNFEVNETILEDRMCPASSVSCGPYSTDSAQLQELELSDHANFVPINATTNAPSI